MTDPDMLRAKLREADPWCGCSDPGYCRRGRTFRPIELTPDEVEVLTRLLSEVPDD